MRSTLLYLLLLVVLVAGSCSVTRSFRKSASRRLLSATELQGADIGISVYDPLKKEYIYQYHADDYFIPASNTKLYTLYTGLNFLDDSTTGIQYRIQEDTLYIRGTGDPSVLHPDFPRQAVFEFLQNTHLPVVLTNPVYENDIFGPGWNPRSYNRYYQPERSAMPLYGNVARFTLSGDSLCVVPDWFSHHGRLLPDNKVPARTFSVRRVQKENIFHYHIRKESRRTEAIPFIINQGKTTAVLLADTLHKPVYFHPYLSSEGAPVQVWHTIHNVPVDSLFKYMMHRSDNFYAEQTLQMCSMRLFDTINTRRMIHYMLNTKLKDLPDPPHWVDGSGLSSRNAFTPRDMITILDKFYKEYPHERIYHILPTGGEGTLSSLYHDMAGSIFAKTGSLNNNIALSGYLITRKGNTLLFSVLINHINCTRQEARIATENFLREAWRNH